MAAFERNVLRRMLGGNIVNKYWRKRYNEELRQLCRDLNILHLSE
jgi:hypothetical protein